MKRIILIAIMLMAAVAANAQIATGTKYKDLKNIYNPYAYVQADDDPYSVAWSGVFGFFVPGSAQLMMKEPVRGWCFLGASAICYSIMNNCSTGLNKLIVTNNDGTLGYSDEEKAAKLTLTIIGALAVDLGISIWSCIDAKKVAKVKNLYFQDITSGKKPVKFNVDPYLSYTPTANSVAPVAGLSFNMAF